MEDSYTEKFQEAEKAVAAIKDEKLRAIAFEKLITHILSNDSQTQKKGSSKKKSEVISATKKKKAEGPKAWILELVDEGFFQSPKSSNDIRQELETRSHHLSPGDLTRPLEALCHEKQLRRRKEIQGGKSTLHWVNWG